MSSPNNKPKRSYKRHYYWDEATTSCLFKYWAKYLKITDEKTKLPFDKIALALSRHGFRFTEYQIKMKIQTMSTRYRQELRNHPTEWMYFEDVDEIFDIPRPGRKSPPVDNTEEFGDCVDEPLNSVECLLKDGSFNAMNTESDNGWHEHFIDIRKLVKEEILPEEYLPCESEITNSMRPPEVSEDVPMNEKINSENLYSVFNKIKSKTKFSIAEFNRVTDLFEEDTKINLEINELVKKYLNNSLDIQIEMLTLIRKMNNKLT